MPRTRVQAIVVRARLDFRTLREARPGTWTARGRDELTLGAGRETAADTCGGIFGNISCFGAGGRRGA
jgi:hypothetical protein